MESLSLNQSGIAVEGYDPVTYFSGKPMLGNPDITFTYQGAIYHFVSEANRSQFEVHPEKYVPQYGGFCATAVSEGKTFGIDPTNYNITNGKLYLDAAKARLSNQEQLVTIGEFTTMIVHEIRNPLTTILLGLNYFTTLDLPTPAQARLSLATIEAERLANLLNEILLYAKPQVLQLREIELNDLMPSLLVLLRSLPATLKRCIQFTPKQSKICVLGDIDKLKQVLMNLILNACEAADAGTTIRCSIIRLKGKVCISVQNYGDVIPPDVLPKLTEPFYSTKPSGTGLGLAIVKRIVEAHEGTFSITSSKHEGTIAEVQLPFYPNGD